MRLWRRKEFEDSLHGLSCEHRAVCSVDVRCRWIAAQRRQGSAGRAAGLCFTLFRTRWRSECTALRRQWIANPLSPLGRVRIWVAPCAARGGASDAYTVSTPASGREDCIVQCLQTFRAPRENEGGGYSEYG